MDISTEAREWLSLNRDYSIKIDLSSRYGTVSVVGSYLNNETIAISNGNSHLFDHVEVVLHVLQSHSSRSNKSLTNL